MKIKSSKWIKEHGIKEFSWQNGYGIFSISQSHIDKLVDYIRSQMKHHKKRSFKEEYIDFLQKYSIKFNSEYIWTE